MFVPWCENALRLQRVLPSNWLVEPLLLVTVRPAALDLLNEALAVCRPKVAHALNPNPRVVFEHYNPNPNPSPNPNPNPNPHDPNSPPQGHIRVEAAARGGGGGAWLPLARGGE
jgi:hypothetical protein